MLISSPVRGCWSRLALPWKCYCQNLAGLHALIPSITPHAAPGANRQLSAAFIPFCTESPCMVLVLSQCTRAECVGSAGTAALAGVFCTAHFYPFAFTTLISSSVKTQLLQGMGLNPPQKSCVLLSRVLDTSPSPALLSAWVEGESC